MKISKRECNYYLPFHLYFLSGLANQLLRVILLLPDFKRKKKEINKEAAPEYKFGLNSLS